MNIAPMEKKTVLRAATIREVSLEILQQDGFDALSLRKIADCLGVQTPALYWYVKNRAELYGLMAEAILLLALSAVVITRVSQQVNG